jgi:D-sedoheptulose 7-phosphate isomerase
VVPMLRQAEVQDRQAVQNYLDQLQAVLRVLDSATVVQAIDLLRTAFERRATVFILGNGGSASTASHFACDLGKGVRGPAGRRFRVVSLTDNVPLLTAWANDTSYELIFAEQLENLVQPHDLVIGISGSGNSPNVLRAMELARARGAVTLGLTGLGGGKLRALCDTCVVVPARRIDLIEDVHLALQHLMCSVLRGVIEPIAVP